jgi:hypothetical protein
MRLARLAKTDLMLTACENRVTPIPPSPGTVVSQTPIARGALAIENEMVDFYPTA